MHHTRTFISFAVVGGVMTWVAGASAQVLLYSDDFDSYASPVTVTTPGPTNGYKVLFGAAAAGRDFTVIFGFDYSTVTFPTNIPPAPHSTNGTTKGLYLTVNKSGTVGANTAVNLYPVGRSFSNGFSLKFDLWVNHNNSSNSTEHALFGINHSANVTNRVGQATSDGLFFAVDGDGDVSATSATVRDFAVLRGGGAAIPVLMLTNNTTFGPALLLGSRFASADPGIQTLFPAKTTTTVGTTRAGSCGLEWVRGEVRQESKLITWLLDDTIVAQYTNNFAYTNGDILLGYNDAFASIGVTDNFAVFDNVRVESIPTPVKLLSPQLFGGSFAFSFATEPSQSYTVQCKTNLGTANWINCSNLIGSGSVVQITLPASTGQFFRVSQP